MSEVPNQEENQHFSSPHDSEPFNLRHDEAKVEVKVEKPKRKISISVVLISLFILIVTAVAIGTIFYVRQNQTKIASINDFESCVAAGNPVMESYPEQCAANGQTFTRVLTAEEQKKLDPTADWKTYRNELYKFEFQYPGNWSLNTNNTDVTKNPYDLYNVGVSSSGTSKSPNLAFGIDIHNSSKETLPLCEAFGPTISTKEIELNEITAIEKTYKTQNGDPPAPNTPKYASKGVCIYFDKNNLHFIIDRSARDPGNEDAYFDENKSLLTEILSTFKFTDQESAIDTSDWKTYNSKCYFTVNYPSSWIAQDKFFSSYKDTCMVMGDEEFKFGEGDAVFGFYIHIRKYKLDSTKFDSLESYVKSYKEIMPFEYYKKQYGPYSGIEFDPPGRGNNRSFMFIKDGYVYEVNWALDTSGPYFSTIPEIISSIKFTE